MFTNVILVQCRYMLQEKREEIQRKNELENKMTEILENLKTRLLVE